MSARPDFDEPRRDGVHPASPGGVRFLDVCPDFGDALSPDARADARRVLVLPTVDVSEGPVTAAAVGTLPNVQGALAGLYVADGLLTTELELQGRVCSRPITPGDFVLFDGADDDSLPDRTQLLAHADARIVALDERLLLAFARWPKLALGLTHRLAVQAHRAQRAQAIAQLPRVEDRLLGLLWMLADEVGRVGGDGIHIGVRLTHETLGRMIGARRPTVSLGMQTLATTGLVTNVEDGWILSHASLERFSTPTFEP